jgi:predicted RecB family nuclease
MTITPACFEAFLKCPTKCWLRAANEMHSGNPYAEWVKAQSESFHVAQTERLIAETAPGEFVRSPTPDDLKTSKCRLAVGIAAQVSEQSTSGTPYLVESLLQAVERMPAEGRGKAAQFIPIRFVYRNKLTKDDRLLLVFDALVLSAALGREITAGKIVYGDDYATLRVKTAGLADEVWKGLKKTAALLSSPAAPDLVLNRHCGECEFQTRCRQQALEKDDLSLLAGMSEKERTKLRSKGIFTVTQLSYTFRPRRRSKRLRNKREKYHHSLKALAIRENKIHIVGNPELRIEGTPVYLDVEGLPDRDFYYLIGMRIGNGDSAFQRSLWADTVDDEGKNWQKFIATLETIEKPVLIHYGSYETTFLKRMADYYGKPVENSVAASAIENPINVVSAIFAQTYFPTFRNTLKDIASFLGFTWCEIAPSGTNTIIWRHQWETNRDSAARERLITYNSEDCRALEIVAQALSKTGGSDQCVENDGRRKDTVSVESLKALETMWPKFKSPIGELEEINKAARWDYQRERIYVRSSRCIRRINLRHHNAKGHANHATKVIQAPEISICPDCTKKTLCRLGYSKLKLHDLKIGKGYLRRRFVEYHFAVFICSECHLRVGEPTEFWPNSKYGRNLVAYILYHLIELCVPMAVLASSMNRLLNFNLTAPNIHWIKQIAAKYYDNVQKVILKNLTHGDMIHLDETRVSIRGKTACVWVLTNLHEVAYLYTENREGEFIQELLKDYNGVLVSDFYTAYDSIDCSQQKCLLHLIRDLNSEVLAQPYDQELKTIVVEFAELLQPMIETIDRHGLKKHFLRKHRKCVDRFFHRLGKTAWKSAAAIKCHQRLEKNRKALFTFLDYDGVPWNNNNAEHAIKAFARLRDVVQGSFTAATIQDYLILLSVCQTCKFTGVDFFDFIRSCEKDIRAFAESRQVHRRRFLTSQPETLSADVTAE